MAGTRLKKLVNKMYSQVLFVLMKFYGRNPIKEAAPDIS
jgi:hypothetical protein